MTQFLFSWEADKQKIEGKNEWKEREREREVGGGEGKRKIRERIKKKEEKINLINTINASLQGGVIYGSYKE